MAVVHRARPLPSKIPFDPRRIRIVRLPEPVPEVFPAGRRLSGLLLIAVNLVGIWLATRPALPGEPGMVVRTGTPIMLLAAAAGLLSGAGALLLRRTGAIAWLAHAACWSGYLVLAILRGSPAIILVALAAAAAHATAHASSRDA